MATVTINTGEKLVVEFADSDGQFEIHFDTQDHPNQIVVKETAGLEGNIKGKALELMHVEQFDTPDDTSMIQEG